MNAKKIQPRIEITTDQLRAVYAAAIAYETATDADIAALAPGAPDPGEVMSEAVCALPRKPTAADMPHLTHAERRVVVAAWQIGQLAGSIEDASEELSAAVRYIMARLAGQPRALMVRTIMLDTLGFESIETRRSDQLDFKDLAVWSVTAALEKAYDAGQASSPGLAAVKEGRKDPTMKTTSTPPANAALDPALLRAVYAAAVAYETATDADLAAVPPGGLDPCEQLSEAICALSRKPTDAELAAFARAERRVILAAWQLGQIARTPEVASVELANAVQAALLAAGK